MTLEQKVGQLFLIRPDHLDLTLSNETIVNSRAEGVQQFTDAMFDTMIKYPAGGFVIFRKNINNPVQLKKFTKALKDSYIIPPLIAVDEEGGSFSRLANHENFKLPKIKSISSLKSPVQTRSFASKISSYLSAFGIDWDFAPVADLNTNPENIVIGGRTFGSDPVYVSKMVKAFLDGLHKYNIKGTLKHFPGHGSTTGDPHKNTVSLEKSWDELKSAELIPFIDNLDKADSIMIAHVTIKNITGDDLPASLSKELVTGKLRDELKYGGIIITDSLAMGAITEHYDPAEAAVLAIEAGNDMLLMPYDYVSAFNGVLNAVRSGRISESRLDESVRRILKLKGVVEK